mmetsp:Transcript_50980/g.157800  ORF Transcript_50980/g.157800 Transcript_50980/m.157800 type:complete len:249 (+) Transcript_50980:55-801(+)
MAPRAAARGASGSHAVGLCLALFGCRMATVPLLRGTRSPGLDVSTFVVVPPAAAAQRPAARLAPPAARAAAAACDDGSRFWAAVASTALAATCALRQRRSTFTGEGSSVAALGLYAGDVVDEPPPTTMFGVQRRPWVRPCKRTAREWRRHNRPNSAAKQRFLIREDGTIWHRQAGLRHLKSKKSKKQVKRLKRMVRVTKDEYKRVSKLLRIKIRKPRADEYIMRKFNEARLTKGLGMSDHGVGTALFV